MTNETRPNLDPVELWHEWYDTATKAWARAVTGEAPAPADPLGLYRQWMKGLATGATPPRKGAPEAADLREAQKEWFETMARTWEASAAGGADALGLMTQWLEMMEEARAKLLAGQDLPADPLTVAMQAYNATSETWSKAAGDIIGTESFVEGASRFLQSYAGYSKTFRQLAQEYFTTLQLATRPDIARVASLVIAVEDKVEQLEDQLDEVQKGMARQTASGLAAAGSLDAVEGRLEGLDQLSARVTLLGEKVARLETVEKRLDHLEAAVGRVQGSLDRLVAALEKGAAAPPAADGEAARKAPVRKALPPEPPSSGAGQG